MSNITDITDRSPNETLVEQLEDLLEQARSGELRSVLFVMGRADDTFSHQWSKDHRNSWKRMVGEVALAQMDFQMASLRDTDSFLDRILEGE